MDALGADEARIFAVTTGSREVGNTPAGSDPHGEFKDKNILLERQDIATTARILGVPEETVSKSLAAGRAKLFERRAKRPRPHLDDKILTAWNGLMISAFSKTGAALRDAPLSRGGHESCEFSAERI